MEQSRNRAGRGGTWGAGRGTGRGTGTGGTGGAGRGAGRGSGTGGTGGAGGSGGGGAGGSGGGSSGGGGGGGPLGDPPEDHKKGRKHGREGDDDPNKKLKPNPLGRKGPRQKLGKPHGGRASRGDKQPKVRNLQYTGPCLAYNETYPPVDDMKPVYYINRMKQRTELGYVVLEWTTAQK